MLGVFFSFFYHHLPSGCCVRKLTGKFIPLEVSSYKTEHTFLFYVNCEPVMGTLVRMYLPTLNSSSWLCMKGNPQT